MCVPPDRQTDPFAPQQLTPHDHMTHDLPQGARVMLFVGGPPTVGPGMIVGRPKTEDIRACLLLSGLAICSYACVCVPVCV